MKKTRLFILFASFILGLLAVCWSRAQTPSHRLKVLDDKGVEVHTLMGDQHNALVGHLEATGQTNTLEQLRQYRCAYGADLASSKLGDTVTALQHLRAGREKEAIQLLERDLGFYASILCNSYGCLNATNRERVKLESLEKTRDYYAKLPPLDWDPKFPPPERSADLERAMNEVLRLSGKPKK
jgi:hypothetical protein